MAFSCILMFWLIIFSTLLISLPPPQYTIPVPIVPFRAYIVCALLPPHLSPSKLNFFTSLGPKNIFLTYINMTTLEYTYERE